MADIAITAANVLKTSTTKTKDGVAGVAILAGQYIVRDPVTRRMILGDGDVLVTDVEYSGVALNTAAIGQPVEYAWGGDLTVGAVLTGPGRIYILSSTPGALAPVADLAVGDFTLVVGIAKSTSIITLNPQTAGVAIVT